MRQLPLIIAIVCTSVSSTGWSVEEHDLAAEWHTNTFQALEPQEGTSSAEGPVDSSSIDAAINDGNVRTASSNIRLSPPPQNRAAEGSTFDFSLNDKRVQRVASALSVVIGIFLFFVVFSRAVGRKKSAPHEIVEVLGRTAISPKHSLHLIRVHDRLILLAETPQGLQQLETMTNPVAKSGDSPKPIEKATPINDPEAQRLLDMIRQSDGWTSAEQIPARLRDTSYAA